MLQSSVASTVFLCGIQGMTHGFCDLFLLLGGAGVGVGLYPRARQAVVTGFAVDKLLSF